MTQDEADKIARIISTANNGCVVCIRALIDRANASGLGFHFRLVRGEKWADVDLYDKRFPYLWPLVIAEAA